MARRQTSKAKSIWSKQANEKKERIRLAGGEDRSGWLDPNDDEIEIVIRRKLTNEKAVFKCTRGDRIDNYMVYCNGKFQGVQSMTTLTKNIRKALPAFKRL